MQIEDARPVNIQLNRYLQASRHEGRRLRKDGRPGGFDKRFNEPPGGCGTGSSAGTGGMRHHAPELEKAGRRDAPTFHVVRSLCNRATCRFMLRATGPVRINEKVGVNSDHGWDQIQPCREERSDTSRPGGSPPGTTTHLIFRGVRRARACEEEANSRRSPRSINTRSGVRVSAARFLARMRSSSGRSTVVFIQENIYPYSHTRQPGPVAETVVCEELWFVAVTRGENRSHAHDAEVESTSRNSDCCH